MLSHPKCEGPVAGLAMGPSFVVYAVAICKYGDTLYVNVTEFG